MDIFSAVSGGTWKEEYLLDGVRFRHGKSHSEFFAGWLFALCQRITIDPSPLDDPAQWAMIWRAYRRKASSRFA